MRGASRGHLAQSLVEVADQILGSFQPHRDSHHAVAEALASASLRIADVLKTDQQKSDQKRHRIHKRNPSEKERRQSGGTVSVDRNCTHYGRRCCSSTGSFPRDHSQVAEGSQRDALEGIFDRRGYCMVPRMPETGKVAEKALKTSGAGAGEP